MFSDRNRRLSPSGTQAITVAVDQLERQGIDIVDLGAVSLTLKRRIT